MKRARTAARRRGSGYSKLDVHRLGPEGPKILRNDILRLNGLGWAQSTGRLRAYFGDHVFRLPTILPAMELLEKAPTGAARSVYSKVLPDRKVPLTLRSHMARYLAGQQRLTKRGLAGHRKLLLKILADGHESYILRRVCLVELHKAGALPEDALRKAAHSKEHNLRSTAGNILAGKKS